MWIHTRVPNGRHQPPTPASEQEIRDLRGISGPWLTASVVGALQPSQTPNTPAQAASGPREQSASTLGLCPGLMVFLG